MAFHSARPRSLLSVLALVASVACGASEREGSAEVEVTLSAVPGTVGPAMLTVNVVDEAWRPLNGAHVTVTPTPPNEATHDPVRALGVGAGRYQVGNFPLDHVGEWRFEVRVELAGGRWATFDVPLRVEEGQQS